MDTELIKKRKSSLINQAKSITLPLKEWFTHKQFKVHLFWMSVIDKAINLLDWIEYAIESKNIYVAYDLLRNLLDLLMNITFISFIDENPKWYRYLDLEYMFAHFMDYWRLCVEILQEWEWNQEFVKESMLKKKCNKIFFKKQKQDLYKIYDWLSRFVHFSNRWSRIVFSDIESTNDTMNFNAFIGVWNENRKGKNQEEYFWLLDYVMKPILYIIQSNNYKYNSN